MLIRVVGLAWEELARALLKPNCEYDTRNVCIFRNVVHELTTAGGMDDRNVAAMLLDYEDVEDCRMLGVPVENLLGEEDKSSPGRSGSTSG